METKRLQQLKKEVRSEGPEESKRRGLQIQAELDMLQAVYEEYRANRRADGVELEREWAINL